MTEIAAVNLATPNESKADTATKAFSEDKDNFLQLFLTSLEHQDPSNPQDSNQLAALMASFTEVEQTLSVNKNLEKLISLTEESNASLNDNALQLNKAVSYIGKEVRTNVNSVDLLEGGTGNFNYTLVSNANEVTVEVLNNQGDVVFSERKGEQVAGRQEFFWNGRDNNGEKQPVGSYTINVRAKDADGEPIGTENDTSGLVKGVTTENNKPVLLVGDEETRVLLERIISVRTPENTTTL